MAKPRRDDWNHWFRVFNELSRSTDISLIDFCGREGLDPECARKAFARRRKEQGKAELGRKPRKTTRAQWAAWKLEFLDSDFESVSDFIRSKGLDPGTGYVSRMTKGWTAQLREIRAKTEAESVAQLADQKGAAAIAALHSRILTALYSCLGDLESNGPKRKTLQKNILWPADNAQFMRGLNGAIDGLLKIMPAISKIEAVVATRDLLQKVLDQSVDVTEAALQLEMMNVSIPDTLKILLAKQEPTQPETPANEIPSDDELERRWREGIDKIKRQEENFVRQRQKEIEELKEECRDFDSFADNTAKE